MVGGEQAGGVGDPVALGEADVVDDVATEGGQLDTVDGLGVAGAGLGELAGDAADLEDGDPGVVREHDRHLEDDPQAVADGVGGGVEGLGAIAGLEQERLAACDRGERLGQVAGLAGEDQRRQFAHLVEHRLMDGVVGPDGLLEGRPVAPRARIPVGAGTRGGSGAGFGVHSESLRGGRARAPVNIGRCAPVAHRPGRQAVGPVRPRRWRLRTPGRGPC